MGRTPKDWKLLEGLKYWHTLPKEASQLIVEAPTQACQAAFSRSGQVLLYLYMMPRFCLRFIWSKRAFYFSILEAQLVSQRQPPLGFALLARLTCRSSSAPASCSALRLLLRQRSKLLTAASQPQVAEQRVVFIRQKFASTIYRCDFLFSR